MHTTKFWAGIVLLLIALLPSVGLTFGIIPAFTGPLLVLVAIAGGYLIVGSSHFSHGWKMYAAIILIALTLLPSIGFILVPSLVFSGTILVLFAAAGGYLLAGTRRR